MNSIKKFANLGDEPAQEEGGIMTEMSGLSWDTRLKGFGICLLVAILLGIGAAIVVFIGDNLSGFAILYTFAVLFGVGSTFFLKGPIQQFKQMFDSKRLISTIVFLVSVVLTLLSALVFKISILVLLFVILQFLALAWYTISYIPYAQQLITNCCSRVMSG